MLIAIAHILGALLAVITLQFAVFALVGWEQERNRKVAAQEISIALGIPATELDDEIHAAKIIRFTADRYSSELLRNRLSDLCGFVTIAWGWLGAALQLAVIGGVIWYSFYDSSAAVNAWWLVAIAVFFFATSAIFALLCRLVTGRYPGQARQARKLLTEVMESQARTTALETEDHRAA